MIDLRCDSVTKPTAPMRKAIAEAEVGDDVLGDDPTVKKLEERAAKLLGKEAAALFPSGIMANLTAMHIVGEPGTEVIIEANGHILEWEVGGATAYAGVLLRPVKTPDGILAAEFAAPAIRANLKYQVTTSAISLENTHNGAGGKVFPLAKLAEVSELARERKLRLHLDGARLWNASAATGVPEFEYASHVDTVMVSLSKGLGCPIGSILAGTREDMDRARHIRRRLGGAMRQSGILAAAALYALDHHRGRLKEDHANATLFAQLASKIPNVSVVKPETNIVMIDLPTPTAGDVVKKMAEKGVGIVVFSPTRIRAVTHLDVTQTQVQEAASALAEVMA